MEHPIFRKVATGGKSLTARWRGRFMRKISYGGREAVLVLALCCLGLLSAPADILAHSVVEVNVNTSPLVGTQAQVAFDFIDGGPPANDNTVTLSNFVTDGTLGTVSLTGGVTGNLPGTVTLTDPTFFNEYLTNITLETDFSFQLNATSNGPGLGSLADAFSLTILDPTTGLPLFSTTDPTGANTLLLLNIDGSSNGALQLYTAPGNQAQVTATLFSPAPEPNTFLLMGSGASGVLLLLLWKKKSALIGA